MATNIDHFYFIFSVAMTRRSNCVSLTMCRQEICNRPNLTVCDIQSCANYDDV
jgi:hypothetical protein